MRGKLKVACLALFIVALAVPLTLNASPILELSLLASGGGTATTLSSTTGFVTYSGPVGNLCNCDITASTGFSGPLLTLPDLLDLSTGTAHTLGTGTLTIMLTAYNITAPLGPSILLSQIGGTQGSGASVTWATYFDPTNTPFGTAVLLNSFDLGSASPFAEWGTAFANLTGPYSLTEIAVITFSQEGTGLISFDGDLRIPEPATLSVLGFGLLAAGTVLRRKLLVR